MPPENYNQFQKTLKCENPPKEWPLALKALWFDAKGNWKASHDIAQDMHNDLGSWIHAYLHRREGDDWNAGYWYQRGPINHLHLYLLRKNSKKLLSL